MGLWKERNWPSVWLCVSERVKNYVVVVVVVAAVVMLVVMLVVAAAVVVAAAAVMVVVAVAAAVVMVVVVAAAAAFVVAVVAVVAAVAVAVQNVPFIRSPSSRALSHEGLRPQRCTVTSALLKVTMMGHCRICCVAVL